MTSRLDAALGDIRELSRGYREGSLTERAWAFRELVSRLLGATVMREDGIVRLTKRTGSQEAWALGGNGGPTDPVPLRDGRYLRVAASLTVDAGTGRLNVMDSSYQYQTATGEPIFRYDYLRVSRNRYATAHLQVNGEFTPQGMPPNIALPRVHFPVYRASLEAVIRVLAEDFDVGCREQRSFWRPLLAASEREFLDIAHVPLSGPDGLLDDEQDN